MVKPNFPRIEIDDLTAAIRQSIAAQKHDGKFSSSGIASADVQARIGSSVLPQLKLQPDFQPHANNRYHINDLLGYHDRVFVENAYRAVLKRTPEATELARDLKRLQSGRFNKIDLLAALCFSTEGKAKGVAIEGLTLPALVRRLGHLPFIGYFVRLGIGLVRLPNQIRDQREFAGYVLSQNQQIADFINSVSARNEQAFSKQLELFETLKSELHEIRAQQSVVQQQLDAYTTEAKEQARQLDRRIDAEKELIQTRIDANAALSLESAGELRGEIERVYSQLQHAQAELTIQGRKLNSLLATAREHVLSPALPESHQLDPLYAALEDRFRGTRDEIKERFKIYLPYVTERGSVIDLGCGRGEWLEILKEAGVNGRGVEKNQILIGQCRERGLNVIEDDVLEHLHALPGESVGAITGFHIIEHIPIDVLVSLLTEVKRVLRPGGVAIFETPNPENVQVGSNFFYLDPSHLHPLPSELMQFLLESRGFHQVEVLKLHPWDAGRVAGEGPLAERFNGYFFGPMDYAIVGWKIEK